MSDPSSAAHPGFRPSYWESTTFLRPVDYLVVGAGLTGLQAALRLKEVHPGREVLLVERGPVPRGASTRNAGFACFGAPTELLADLDAYGPEAMLATVRARYEGIRELRRRCTGRDVDWADHGGFEIIDEALVAQRVAERLPELNRMLASVTGNAQTWTQTDNTNGHYTLRNALEAQLHPGKLVADLLERCRRAGVRTLFGANVEAVEGRGVEVAELGKLEAGAVLLTVNAFARALLPAQFGSRIRPVRNQVLLSRKIPDLILRGCYHYHEGYVYFRNVGPDRLLIGGGRHLAGERSETDRFGPHEELTEQLVALLNRWLPEYGLSAADFPERWSGIIAQGDGKTPILEFAPNGVLVAGRLAGMGVALSADLALRAAELLAK